jgi:hypothetical protein
MPEQQKVKLRVKKKTALRIFKALHIKDAENWSNKKIRRKLSKLPQWLGVYTGTGDEELDEVIQEIFDNADENNVTKIKLRIPKSELEAQRKEQEEFDKQLQKGKEDMVKKNKDKKKDKAKDKTKKKDKTKAESKPKKSTKAESKPKKSTVETDGFGEKLTTNYHKINVTLSKAKKPLSYKKLLEKIGLETGSYYHYLNKLIAAGRARKTAKGRFELTAKGKKRFGS